MAKPKKKTKPFSRKAWLILHVNNPHRLTFHQPYGLMPLSNVMPVKLVQCGQVFGLGNPSRGKRKKVKPRTDRPTTIKRKDLIW